MLAVWRHRTLLIVLTWCGPTEMLICQCVPSQPIVVLQKLCLLGYSCQSALWTWVLPGPLHPQPCSEHVQTALWRCTDVLWGL